MKSFIFYISLILAPHIEAATTARFFGLQTMIQLGPKDLSGISDNDTKDLYHAMNVPIKNSFIGPGKAIVSADQKLNFVCGLRNTSYECTIILQNGPNTQTDLIQRRVQFHVEGPSAIELSDKFFMKDGEFKFVSTDRLFKIEAQDGRFTMTYSAAGL